MYLKYKNLIVQEEYFFKILDDRILESIDDNEKNLGKYLEQLLKGDYTETIIKGKYLEELYGSLEIPDWATEERHFPFYENIEDQVSAIQIYFNELYGESVIEVKLVQEEVEA